MIHGDGFISSEDSSRVRLEQLILIGFNAMAHLWVRTTTRQVAKRMNKCAVFLEVQNFCDVVRGQIRVDVCFNKF